MGSARLGSETVQKNRLKVVIGYETFGPYHLARLEALAVQADLLAIEFARESGTYAWGAVDNVPFRRITLAARPEEPSRKHRFVLDAALCSFRPDVILAPGWASPHSLSLLRWGIRFDTPVILMSDSQEIDETRYRRKEFVKSQLLRLFDGAFVAGVRHADYLTKLGFKKPVRTGYDVVDNGHFSPPAIKGERTDFFCCARLVAKKNIHTLIEAYRIFLLALGSSCEAAPRLVIAGSGILRDAIQLQIEALSLTGKVVLSGYVDYEHLPMYYHRALGFILPSTTEQWGLVVNEAMAAGCAVIVSERAGCAPDLVRDGENGFTIDPHEPQDLANRLLWMHRHREALPSMGQRSTEIISDFTPNSHASAIMELGGIVAQAERRKKSLVAQALLAAILGRDKHS